MKFSYPDTGAFDFAPLEREADAHAGEGRRVRRLIHVPHWGRGFK